MVRRRARARRHGGPWPRRRRRPSPRGRGPRPRRGTPRRPRPGCRARDVGEVAERREFSTMAWAATSTSAAGRNSAPIASSTRRVLGRRPSPARRICPAPGPDAGGAARAATTRCSGRRPGGHHHAQDDQHQARPATSPPCRSGRPGPRSSRRRRWRPARSCSRSAPRSCRRAGDPATRSASVHSSLVRGPGGASYGGFWNSPQPPPKSSQASGPSGIDWPRRGAGGPRSAGACPAGARRRIRSPRRRCARGRGPACRSWRGSPRPRRRPDGRRVVRACRRPSRRARRPSAGSSRSRPGRCRERLLRGRHVPHDLDELPVALVRC